MIRKVWIIVAALLAVIIIVDVFLGSGMLGIGKNQ